MPAFPRRISLLRLTPRYSSRITSVIACAPKHTAFLSIFARPRPSIPCLSTCVLLPHDIRSSSKSPQRVPKPPRIHATSLSTDANHRPSPLKILLTHAHMRSEIDVKEDLLPPESLTPESRLSRVYETLYVVFSYIGQNEAVEEGVQSLHVRIVGDGF